MVSSNRSDGAPSIQHLPVELQKLIIDNLTTYIRECRGALNDSHPTHSNSTCGFIPVTHPSILHLRATNRHFRALIPLSLSLVVATERSSFAAKKRIWGCCVCLQLKKSSQFATLKYGYWFLQERESERYRQASPFCLQCGTRSADEERPGTQPRGMTTYAPGTKLTIGGVGWVWCMECRKVKTGDAAGHASCRLFCEECCRRLDCWGLATNELTEIKLIHRGYQATDPATPLRDSLQVGQQDIRSYKVSWRTPQDEARSLLLPDSDNIASEDDSGPDDGEWKAWFD